jgi:beta-fructofuranosidase
MRKNNLNKARKFEKEQEKRIKREDRPLFHLTPRIGWMNDPNGFCFYQGKYHLFYQYHPYSCIWGPMHWGHAVSDDLISWEPLPAALAPDSKNDFEGCFSGCGIERDDGKLALIYTGVRKNPSDKKKNVQIQCMAVGDGRDFEKLKSPVIDSSKVPAGCSIEDFRDPKVIRGEDGAYYLYAVNKNADGRGQVLVYKSKDLTVWDFCNVAYKNDSGPGSMLECPDVFELDGHDILMLSAQEVLQSDDFDAGNIGLCLIGHYDKSCHKFVAEKKQQIDRGLDFYAQQTIKAPDGRRIMIGWLQNWDICNYREKDAKWYGQMSLPREIWIENGALFQRPVKEIEKYWGRRQEIKGLKVKDEKKILSEIQDQCLDMTVTVRKCDNELSYFNINLFEGEASDGSIHYARVYYDYKLGKAGIDRSCTGTKAALLHERSCGYKIKDGEDLKLRIITDRNSVEVFFGQGELAMSMSIYDETKGQGISFEALGGAEIDILSYELALKEN